ncbi:unnamed protein product [Timema podura]|uniref:Uncharacterized protein n=1 Tax=Timema podura TaxID=61482 RepID=A0ABN7P0C9_TIMPD|nr:unnamed protein product [Timema podura]
MWLVRYLEDGEVTFVTAHLTRQLILEDLRVVKTLCVPCFPPQYDIVNKFVNMYHTCLSAHLHYNMIYSMAANKVYQKLATLCIIVTSKKAT